MNDRLRRNSCKTYGITIINTKITLKFKSTRIYEVTKIYVPENKIGVHICLTNEVMDIEVPYDNFNLIFDDISKVNIDLDC